MGDEHSIPVRYNFQRIIVEDRHLPVAIHEPADLGEDGDCVSWAPFLVDNVSDVPWNDLSKTSSLKCLTDTCWPHDVKNQSKASDDLKRL